MAPGEMLTHALTAAPVRRAPIARLLGRSFGSRQAMVDLRTSGSMIADKVKPRISDQVTCQVIDTQRMQQPVHDVHG